MATPSGWNAGGSWGSWGQGATPAPVAPHRSFLGNLEHILGQTGTDLVDALRGTAGAAVHGAVYAGTHDPVTTALQLPKIGEAMYHQTVADLSHPLRHPGFTA